MATHERAGQLPRASDLVDLSRLISDYYSIRPDPTDPAQRVQFGTSGHRGSASRGSFNERHLTAIVQAVCEWRARSGISGPMFVAKDTHALSEPAWRTTLEVLASNGVEAWSAPEADYVPTPLLSRAIVARQADHPLDGLAITPSHNPPTDGGIKYNPPHGGPAEGTVTSAIEARANELLATEVSKRNWVDARSRVRWFDFSTPYVQSLAEIVDMKRIAASGIRLGADPLGGATVGVWEPLAEQHRLNLHVVNPEVDGTFRFVPLDSDGKIRMDCSSRHAMAELVRKSGDYDLAFGNDADGDRHGIVTKQGLMNPNQVLALAVDTLFRTRVDWRKEVGAAITVVTSDLVHRVTEAHGRSTIQTPVGFKWFVPLLLHGNVGLAGEESAGASILSFDGRPWTTDKDGIVMDLLAAEMMARSGRDLSELYLELTQKHGVPHYRRIDAPAPPERKAVLKKLSADAIQAETLAGELIVERMVAAPGNGEPIGGLKVTTASGWFAARPSGTEDVYKIYAESFRDEAHLDRLLSEARELVERAFEEAGV